MQNIRTDQERRRIRRRRRVQVLVLYTAIALGLAWFFESQATTTLIFVRHADKAVLPADDPALSPAGLQRAAELARQLVDADVVAGIDAVYATPYRRAQETAQPVADALGLPITAYDAADTEQVLDDILDRHKGKIVLVVGHSDTIPNLIANLGASKNVPPIADNEYDNIYLISIPWFGKTKTIRMRYGQPYLPSAPVAAEPV
ncbi:MAG: phosphoglycerate mutase family protein [Pseudomonadota bacterium]